MTKYPNLVVNFDHSKSNMGAAFGISKKRLNALKNELENLSRNDEFPSETIEGILTSNKFDLHEKFFLAFELGTFIGIVKSLDTKGE